MGVVSNLLISELYVQGLFLHNDYYNVEDVLKHTFFPKNYTYLGELILHQILYLYVQTI